MSAVGGLLVAGLALPVVGGIGITARNASNRFQSLSDKLPNQLPQRSEIVDNQGHVLAYFYGHVYGQSNQVIDRVPVTFNQIAPVMRSAILAIEDSRFYQHAALDVKGTVRAAVEDMRGGNVQGGSTIAQQYVKNVLILTAKTKAQAEAAASDTIGRKIRELRYAVAVEHEMTKNELLAAYLNIAYFGQQAYGVQVAAERYFNTTAARLTLPQAALLAGIVENPSEYDPMSHSQEALARRNVVLGRMAQLGWITNAQALAAAKTPMHLKPTTEPYGCAMTYAPFYCDYVTAVINHDPEFRRAAALLNGVGGLKIHTTLSHIDQRAAQRAVNYQMPPHSRLYNPGHNANTEVLLQPGTGKVKAIAINQPYGTGRGQTVNNYAVGPQYNGSYGMQIGSTGKVYTMVAALLQGMPFGFSMSVPKATTVTGFTNCKGQRAGWDNATQQAGAWTLHNDESEGGGHYTLYTGTTLSINTFFAHLEQKVGLCEVVKTADRMGLTWPDGRSLLKTDRSEGHHLSADNIPSFTLGAANVAPIDVAAADATLPARGIYCHPIVVTSIVDRHGRHLPVKSAGCHRVLPPEIADAANYILQGDLTGLGTAANDGIGRPAASKTGTADNYYYAAFVGYTPELLGTVVVGNARDPVNHPMIGEGSCYRGGCQGFMYGSMAPGKTWQMTFMHASLADPPRNFVAVPSDSPFFSKGNGQYVPPKPKPKPKPRRSPPPGGGGHGGGGGGNVPPTGPPNGAVIVPSWPALQRYWLLY
jgi:membrane peptidoglycan carboxypeptidase